MVVDYSSNNGFSSVNWGEFFTQKLLDREVVMLRRFEYIVKSMELVPEVEDWLSWVHNSNEEFTKLKVPPRVRSFLWMLAILRIPTKEFLVKRGVQLQHILIRCLWCEREVEWKLVEGFAEFYSLCYNVKLSRVRRSLWLLSISTTCSSVWIARNEIIFQRKVMIMIALIFQSKMRAILWIKVVYDELMCLPPQGCLKFNVCGIANEEVASCGGVPRDIEGVARALFSSPIAANDADSTKTGADMRPSLLRTTFLDIERKIEQVGSVVFSMAYQKGNEMALTLAVA
ncbi:hypothetical protein Golob_026621, partial [Gossypium lobatum]|nr:hypothetical protein [Gossypium lobatum]